MITRDVVVPKLAVLLSIAWATAPALAAETAPQAAPAPFNNHCRTCHSVKEGDHRIGPSLHKIYGAKAGAAPGYAAYSQGLKSSGLTWNDATLDKFIENPDQVIPNNNMKPYKGIDDPGVRKQIIDYLKSQGA
jgi:cytochrome c